ncbi:MAG: Crp/Fnr family transcriptional regulator [Bacteroidales bacterium]
MNGKLIECSLFKGLITNDLESLFSGIEFFEKKYKKDELIASAGAEVRSLLILANGIVRAEMVDYSGNTVKIEDIEAPNLLAPAFLFGSANVFPVNTIANTEVTLVIIPKRAFLKLLQKNEILLNNFLDNISSRAQFLSGKLKMMTFQTIKGKLAHFFVQEMTKSGKNEFTLSKSQNQLAEMFGVARPSVGRAIRELHEDGIILANGKNIEIVDLKGLKNLLK